MPDDPSDRLLTVSLRLKAARFLAGRRSDDDRAIAIPVAELARHPLLVENRITRNRLEDYEQMTAGEPRPMELRIIAEALDVTLAFLLGEEEDDAGVTSELRAVRTLIEEMRNETQKRYDKLDRLLTQREETERRLRHMSAEEADEVVRLLAEARNRLGRDIGRRDLPAGGAKGRRTGSGEAGG